CDTPQLAAGSFIIGSDATRPLAISPPPSSKQRRLSRNPVSTKSGEDHCEFWLVERDTRVSLGFTIEVLGARLRLRETRNLDFIRDPSNEIRHAARRSYPADS
ncbi:MAG TPA: hypothetical protein VN666_12805, partial [Nitrospira sp.]|nr:hypothetical protein [Nitrospira sp.]